MVAVDILGRVPFTNEQDTSMFLSHVDIHHYSPHDKRTFALAILIVATVLTTVSTILRVYTRTRLIRAFGADDWFMVTSQLAFYHYAGFQYAEIVYGTGLRRTQMTLPHAEMGLKYWYFCAIAYSLTTAFVKVSIGLFLLRFTTHRSQVYLIWLVNILAMVIGTGYFIFLLLTCHPFNFYWHLEPEASGYCFSATVWLNVGYFVAALNVLGDTVFAVIPMFIVMGTTMKRKTKIGVCILLGMGSVAAVGTILRTCFGHTFSRYKHEFLFETAIIASLSTVELGLGITAANMATTRPLFRQIRDAWDPAAGREATATVDINIGERGHFGGWESNIRWVMPPNPLGQEEKRGNPFFERRSMRRPREHIDMSSNGSRGIDITGENIEDVPDLTFAQSDDVEKGETLREVVFQVTVKPRDSGSSCKDFTRSAP